MKGLFIDSHSHLADPRLKGQVQQILEESAKQQIGWHLQGGVGPEDWAEQLRLAEEFPQILPVLGLHPYWVSDHNDEDCEQALSQLSRLAHRGKALGELGMDLRPHIVKDAFERQVDVFSTQLELAQLLNKPVVLHVVRAFKETQRILELYGIPKAGGFVHSFNGSRPEAEAYLQMGLHLSIGGPITRQQNQKLEQAVEIIPLESLLLETDSPDQPPEGHVGENRPSTIWQVAEKIAKIKGLSAAEILDISSQNCRKLLQL